MDVTLFPIVQEEQREQWNNFSGTNDQWIPESLAVLEGIPVEEVEYEPVQPLAIFNGKDFVPVDETMPGPYAPQWLTFPAFRGALYNNNAAYGTFETSVATALATGQPVFTRSVDTFDEPPDSRRTHAVAKMVEAAQDGILFQNDALAPIFYPVFDNFLDYDPQSTGANRTVRALLRAGIYWRSYFMGLLPASSEGILVVLENNCDNVYTYRIDGSEAHCLGRGDLHDPKYDYLEASVAVKSLLDLEEDSEEGQCYYGLRVYPSQELEDTYTTHKPAIFALLLAATFVLTAATFLLYDYCVQRRQRIVMKSAQQSGKIVQSLFPSEVRDRLYQEQEAKERQQTNAKGNAKKTQEDFFSVEGNSYNLGPGFGYTKASAIANLYPDCTVLFADIAGFTKWSSSRTPTEVFDLLESIYAVFDATARRRCVFKIETIGDCYVAATGLPNPQADHAVIMAKFASDCQKKLRELMRAELIGRLGNDTGLLGIRFGLHSGPVTAGVLRGEKARFQIFGDTVNTAARMESHGLPEKIHVSQATADLLAKAGKGDWLIKREEMVSAKGKGDMQTYFVNVISTGKSIASTRSFASSISLASTFSYGDMTDDGKEENEVEVHA